MDNEDFLSVLGAVFLVLLLAGGVVMGFLNIGTIHANTAIKDGWFEYDHKVYRVIPAEVK